MKNLSIISYFCRNFVNRKVELPVRSSDMGLLIFISENKEVTSSNAKEFFEVSKPMVSAMVKRLLSKGYIKRKPDKLDNRKQLLKLTKLGKELVEESKAAYTAYEYQLKEELGHLEYAKLIKQLEKANTVIRRMKI